MAITIEFWKDKTTGYLKVLYDNDTYSFAEFLQTPKAGFIIHEMYKKIQYDYPVEDSGDPSDTVGKFINNHFTIADKTFDVVILGDERKCTVIFNLEK